MSRPFQESSFSTRALVFLCFIAVFTSWAVLEAGAWVVAHAIEWMTGSSDVENQGYVGVALLKILIVDCIAWALISAPVLLLFRWVTA